MATFSILLRPALTAASCTGPMHSSSTPVLVLFHGNGNDQCRCQGTCIVPLCSQPHNVSVGRVQIGYALVKAGIPSTAPGARYWHHLAQVWYIPAGTLAPRPFAPLTHPHNGRERVVFDDLPNTRTSSPSRLESGVDQSRLRCSGGTQEC